MLHRRLGRRSHMNVFTKCCGTAPRAARHVWTNNTHTWLKKRVMAAMARASSNNDEVEPLLRASGELPNVGVDWESRGASTPT